MDSYRYEILMRGNTFLAQVWDDETVQGAWNGKFENIQVKRADKVLMTRVPSMSSYSSMAWTGHSLELYFAVTRKGKDFEVVKLDCAVEDRTESGRDEAHEDADPIGEQLFNLGISPDWIVCFNRDDQYSYKEAVILVTIHKMKDFDLAQQHCEQIDRAAEDLKAEIRMACNPA